MSVSNNSANNNSQAFSGNLVNGDVMISWLPGVTAFNSQAFIMYLLLGGNNLDMRYMYSVAHQGFGGVGFANLITTIRSFNNTAGAYTFNSLSLNTSGQIILNSTITSGSFSYTARLTPYGTRFLVKNV